MSQSMTSKQIKQNLLKESKKQLASFHNYVKA